MLNFAITRGMLSFHPYFIGQKDRALIGTSRVKRNENHKGLNSNCCFVGLHTVEWPRRSSPSHNLLEILFKQTKV